MVGRSAALALVALHAGLLFAPSPKAYSDHTVFLPPHHDGAVRKAMASHCTTQQPWAETCWKAQRDNSHDSYAQSGLESLDLHAQYNREASTRFLPDNHNGVACQALMPACMTRGQWAQVCKGERKQDPNYVFPKSCRDALGLP